MVKSLEMIRNRNQILVTSFILGLHSFGFSQSDTATFMDILSSRFSVVGDTSIVVDCQCDNDSTLTGTCKLFKDERLHSLLSLNNGKMNGWSRYYSKNGRIYLMEYYQMDNIISLIMFYPNGKLYKEEEFIFQLNKTKLIRTYRRTGSLLREKRFDELGIILQETTFRRNEKVKFQFNYKDGKLLKE
jgi:hypothetical protein